MSFRVNILEKFDTSLSIHFSYDSSTINTVCFILSGTPRLLTKLVFPVLFVKGVVGFRMSP